MTRAGSPNLASRTLHSLKWTYGAAIVSALAQIGYSAVMARLLDPAAFGLLAMAMAALRFGSYFGQMGVGSALVQKEAVANVEIRAAFTSSALLGLVFFALFWVSGPLIGRLYSSSELVPIVRVMAVTLLVNNLAVTSQALLRRNLRFRILSIIDLVAYVGGYCVTGIAMALTGWGVWSLVGAALVHALISTVWLNSAVRHSFLPTLNWAHFKKLYSFGSKVSVISFLEFLSSSLDTLLIGATLGATSLGLYNRGQMIARLPLQLFSTSLTKVLFPALSSVQRDTEKLRQGYLLLLGVAGSVLMAAGLGMSVAAPELVSILLGPGWDDAIPVLIVLAIATPLHLLTHFGGVLLEAQAALNAKLVLQSCYLLLLFLLFTLLKEMGLLGFGLALIVGALLLNVAYAFVICRLIDLQRTAVVSSFGSSLASGVATALAIYASTRLMTSFGAPDGLVLALQVLVGAATMIAVLFLGPQRKASRALLRRALPNEPSLLAFLPGQRRKLAK